MTIRDDLSNDDDSFDLHPGHHNELATAVNDLVVDVAAHIADASGAHVASAIGFTPFGSIAATNVQAALAELVGEGGTYSDEEARDAVGAALTDSATIDFTVNDGADTITAVVKTGSIGTAHLDFDPATQTELDAHLSDTADAHDASAVSFVPAGAIAATNVQAALEELDTEKATAAALTAHISDSSAAHAASAISVSPFDDIEATDVQAALEEIAGLVGGGGYSDEEARDAVGVALTDSSTIDFTVNDGADTITAAVKSSSITTGMLAFDPATQVELDAHIDDTSDAHDASAISYAGATGISASDVEAALDELDTEKAPLASPALTGTPTVPTAAPSTNTTQAASTAYVMAQLALAVTGLLELAGSTDASANPNYPAALKGDSYYITVAGKIGGASGKSVDIGDLVVAKADNAGGTEASVGTSWFVLEHNLAGALLAANNLSDLASASTARTNLGLAIGTNVQAWDADLDTWATKTAPSGTAVGTTDTQTLTNKRLTERSSSPSFSATPTINTDNLDCVELSGLSGAITSMTTNLTGTPTNFQNLVIRYKDDGTARAITHGASFVAGSVALPTTTVISKWKTVVYSYFTSSSKWCSMSVLDEV